jgi:hypothetical protein
MISPRYRWICLLVAAAPALLPLWMILHDGVDTHFWDEWDPDWAGMYIRAHNHQLQLSEIFKQHNEHRMVVSRLISLTLNHFDQWNNIHLLIVGWIAVCITSLGLLALCRQTAREMSIARWFLCNLLLFSPVQVQNWLWGAGPPYFLAPMFVILAFVIIGSNCRDWVKILASMLLGTAAIYSNGNGALCLPLCGLLLFWRGSWKEMKSRLWILGLMILATGIVAGSYLYHYKQPQFNGDSGYGGTPGEMGAYFLAFMGSPFGGAASMSRPAAIAQICGTIFLFLYFVSITYFLFASIWRDEELCRRALPWIAVGAFSILSALLATHARSKYGPDQALETRYTTGSLYLPISLINLLPLISANLRKRWAWSVEFALRAPAFAAAALITLQLLCLPAALDDSAQWRASQRAVKADLMLINILPHDPDLNKIFPAPDVLIDLANQANNIRFLHPPLIDADNADMLRADESDANPAARGNLDGYLYDAPGHYRLVGWAINPRSAEPADAVFITYKDSYQRPIICALAKIGFKRDDIVKLQGHAAYEHCGWQATISTALLPAGMKSFDFQAWALDTDTGRAIQLDGGIVLPR